MIILFLYFEVQFADGYSVTRECENIWDSTSDSHIVSYDVDTFSSRTTALDVFRAHLYAHNRLTDLIAPIALN